MAHLQTNEHSSQDTAGEMKVTHVTIRQSLFFLSLKLAFLEVMAAMSLLVIVSGAIELDLVTYLQGIKTVVLMGFALLVCIKTALTFYIIADWVDEYYEISSRAIRHKRGILFKHEQENMLEHLATVKLEQGILGRIFNYGTLTLYNWASEKEFVLYLIHSPHKYMRILRQILSGNVDVERSQLRTRIVDVKEYEK